MALGLLGAAPVAASSGDPPVDLEAMARRAGVIIAGRVVRVCPGTHPRYPRLGVTFVTVHVAEALKGAEPGDFTFMQIGHAADALPPLGSARTFLIPDLPTYRPGEELLLFLYPATQTGLTSPVDGRRGKWPLERGSRDGTRRVAGMRLSPSPGHPPGGGTPLAAVRARVQRAAAVAAGQSLRHAATGAARAGEGGGAR
jgi:hypothetical protein